MPPNNSTIVIVIYGTVSKGVKRFFAVARSSDGVLKGLGP